MTSEQSSFSQLATRDSPLVDCHAHIIPERALRRFPDPAKPAYVTAEPVALQRMLDEHDRVGITHAVVSDSFFMESAREALPSWSSVDRARLFNDSMVELVGRYPRRFFGLGCIDPFGGEASARELERLTRDLGLYGVLLNPSLGDGYLDAAEAEPFLAAAVALAVPLFLHPSRDLPAPEDSREFALNVSLARPHQTATCIARMIYSGTFDRHPGLRLLLAHAGGTLPYLAGRLDATWQGYRPGRWDGPDVLTRQPSSYLAELACDTNTWSAPALRLAIETFGIHNVLFGNDLPSVWVPLDGPIETLRALGLSEPDLEAVRWSNAARFFGLPMSDFT
jgi:aminocarboxymuconate-semialdehyde decarboxylase